MECVCVNVTGDNRESVINLFITIDITSIFATRSNRSPSAFADVSVIEQLIGFRGLRSRPKSFIQQRARLGFLVFGGESESEAKARTFKLSGKSCLDKIELEEIVNYYRYWFY